MERVLARMLVNGIVRRGLTEALESEPLQPCLQSGDVGIGDRPRREIWLVVAAADYETSIARLDRSSRPRVSSKSVP
jgi:hypothetical protein